MEKGPDSQKLSRFVRAANVLASLAVDGFIRVGRLLNPDVALNYKLQTQRLVDACKNLLEDPNLAAVLDVEGLKVIRSVDAKYQYVIIETLEVIVNGIPGFDKTMYEVFSDRVLKIGINDKDITPSNITNPETSTKTVASIAEINRLADRVYLLVDDNKRKNSNS